MYFTNHLKFKMMKGLSMFSKFNGAIVPSNNVDKLGKNCHVFEYLNWWLIEVVIVCILLTVAICSVKVR